MTDDEAAAVLFGPGGPDEVVAKAVVDPLWISVSFDPATAQKWFEDGKRVLSVTRATYFKHFYQP